MTREQKSSVLTLGLHDSWALSTNHSLGHQTSTSAAAVSEELLFSVIRNQQQKHKANKELIHGLA